MISSSGEFFLQASGAASGVTFGAVSITGVVAVTFPASGGSGGGVTFGPVGISGVPSVTFGGVSFLGPVGITGIPSVTFSSVGVTFPGINVGITGAPSVTFGVAGVTFSQNVPNNIIDPNNSTSTPLAGGGSFNGTGTDALFYNAIGLYVTSDVDSATNGCVIQFSSDNSSWETIYSFTLDVSETNPRRIQIPLTARYVRVNYTNGSSDQGYFRLATKLFNSDIRSSVVRLDAELDMDRDASLVRGVITGETSAGGGGFVNVKVNPSGTLEVNSNQDTHDDLNANVNLQVNDTDVSPANPVPIDGLVGITGPVGVTFGSISGGVTFGPIGVSGVPGVTFGGVSFIGPVGITGVPSVTFGNISGGVTFGPIGISGVPSVTFGSISGGVTFGPVGISGVPSVTFAAVGVTFPGINVGITGVASVTFGSIGFFASSTSGFTSITGVTASVRLFAANTSRLGASIFNDSSAILYLKLGATASITSYTTKMYQDDYYEVPFKYVGVIDAIWAGATGAARLTEFS